MEKGGFAVRRDMPTIEYVIKDKIIREEIGEDEIERAFCAIEKYQLEMIFIYDYDYKLFYIQKYQHEDITEKFDLEIHFCYDQRVIGLFNRNLMKKIKKKREHPMQHGYKLTFEIPYGERSKYIPLLKQVNDMCELSGYVGLTAYNNPIDGSKLYCIVETESKYDVIKDLIENENLLLSQEKNLDTTIEDSLLRLASSISLTPSCSEKEIIAALKYICLFPEYEILEKRGLDFRKGHTKIPKVFFSYSHNDEETVLEVEKIMRKKGGRIWIDKKDIDVGEHIVDKIMKGISESDLGLLFMSKSYAVSDMCKHELRTFFTKNIFDEKKWFLVRLDDIDPEELYSGFGMYKYYDYDNAENLSDSILQRIEKLK